MRFFAILIGLMLFEVQKNYSQETKHSISIGLNQSVFDGFGATGPLLRADYNYHLNKYMQLSSIVHVGAGSRLKELGSYRSIDQIYSYGIGVQVKYIPFPDMNIVNRIKFQFGVNYNLEKEIYATEQNEDLPAEIEIEELNSFKPIIGVEINLLKTPLMDIGYAGIFNPPTILQGYHGLVLTFNIKDN